MDKYEIGEKLLQLKEQLRRKEKEQSELQGEYKSLTNRLNKDFRITDTKDIDKRLESLDEDIRTLEEKEEEKIFQVGKLFEEGVE